MCFLDLPSTTLGDKLFQFNLCVVRSLQLRTWFIFVLLTKKSVGNTFTKAMMFTKSHTDKAIVLFCRYEEQGKCFYLIRLDQKKNILIN